MSHTTPQVFENISPDQFARLTEKAREAGIDMAGHSGSTAKMGVEVAWDYSPDSRQLTLHCIKTPFFIDADDVNRRIHALVTETLATA